MNKNFEDYLKAILEHYEVVKNGKDADFLEKPTPGNLKKLCVQLLENGLSNADEQAFMNFFFPTKEQTLLGLTRTMNADSRLRTPSDFLRTKQGLTNNRQHANFVAVLIGFEPRPFTTFQNIHIEQEEKKNLVEEKKVFLTNVESREENNIKNSKEEKEEKTTTTTALGLIEKKKQTQSRTRKIAMATTAILLFGGMSGLLIHKTTEKQCMVWKENHYERVDCKQSATSNIMTVEKVYPYNEELFLQEKIIPTDTTSFFRDGKPIVYYLKHDNDYEFFKQPGFHPSYGSDRKLRPVTIRIVRNWENSKNIASKP